MRVLRLLVLLVFALPACAALPGQSLPELPQVAEEGYRLDSGDQLQVVVFGQEQISGEFTVNDAGSISMPLIGNIEARGQTTQDLEAALAEALKEGGYLVDPHVSIQVQKFRPFYILGEVKDPGQYDYAPGMTVLTAVAIAGGFTYRAQTNAVKIVRRIDGQATEGRAYSYTTVQPGDIIYVFERFF